MIHSHPPPLPPKNPPQLLPQLLPHPQPPELPPQQDSSRRIQIQFPPPFPHPHPLLVGHPQESLHPQFVAVKSLMFLSLHRFIYALFYAGLPVNVSRENTETFIYKLLFSFLWYIMKVRIWNFGREADCVWDFI